jgi:hypothetical protein
MTQFIKVTTSRDQSQTLYLNADYVICILPANQWEHHPHTQIRVHDSSMGYTYRDYSIKETPEEILAQLK